MGYAAKLPRGGRRGRHRAGPQIHGSPGLAKADAGWSWSVGGGRLPRASCPPSPLLCPERELSSQRTLVQLPPLAHRGVHVRQSSHTCLPVPPSPRRCCEEEREEQWGQCVVLSLPGSSLAGAVSGRAPHWRVQFHRAPWHWGARLLRGPGGGT